MAETIMAYPELRHPFEETPVHPPGSTTVLYQGRAVTFAKIRIFLFVFSLNKL